MRKIVIEAIKVLPILLNDHRFTLKYCHNEAQYFEYCNILFYINDNGGEVNVDEVNVSTVSIPYDEINGFVTAGTLAMRIKQYLDDEIIDFKLIINEDQTDTLLRKNLFKSIGDTAENTAEALAVITKI